MAVCGIELEVGQRWLTRGGQQVEIVQIDNEAQWPVVVSLNRKNRYTVTDDGYALASDSPRDTDLVQPLRRGSDHAAPLPVAEPQDSNTVTSTQVNDWIEWHGGECPVGPSTPCAVLFRGCDVAWEHSQPGDLIWQHRGSLGDIVAYRVVKPVHVTESVDVGADRLSTTIDTHFGKLTLRGNVPVHGVGDINSDAKGSGARFNSGKPALELIPLSIIVPFYTPEFEQEAACALRALEALGMFQAREGNVYEVLRELGDHWDGCAQVFDYGRRKYAEWNWAKGMAWSVPIGCAARHLMAIIRGETTDPESGFPHAAHVYCNVVMLLTYAGTFAEGDDRPAKGMLL